MEEGPRFCVPELDDNPEGWGPTSLPDEFSELPYAPFSRNDRLGTYRVGRYNSQYGGVNQSFFFQHEGEDSFRLVDTRPQRPRGYRKFHRMQRSQPRRGQWQLEGKTKQQAPRRRKKDWRRWRQYRRWSNWLTEKKAPLEPSLQVQPTWKEWYNPKYDSVSTRSAVPLRRIEKSFFQVTTSDDPVIRKLASDNIGQVYATDSILAALMTVTKAVYSWDIVITKAGSKLFLDKRDNSQFDFLTVNETAVEPPSEEKDSINSAEALSREATFINQTFSQQVLSASSKKKPVQFEKPNPFLADAEGEDVASVAYRYRKFQIGDLSVVARCDVDAVCEDKGQTKYMLVKALNEYDPRLLGHVDWRQKLDSQRGAVLATELKNNACKMAKWTAQAVFSGVDLISLGYVSRINPKDSYKHTILGTQHYTPKECALHFRLDLNHMFGTLKHLLETCMSLDNGKYVLLKEPGEKIIRLYSVPDDFDDQQAEAGEGVN